MTETNAGLYVDVSRLGVAFACSICVAGLRDEVDLFAAPRDVSA
jgi:hypothetical protein